MTPQEIANARARLERENRGRTHWHGCREAHPACMAIAALDALAEAQRDIAALEAALNGEWPDPQWPDPADQVVS